MAEKKGGLKGFFGEFKQFITRGNVMDMAVGVIVGGAFTAIITALSDHILKPRYKLAACPHFREKFAYGNLYVFEAGLC